MSTSKLSVLPVFDFGEVAYDKENEVHLDVVLSAPEKTGAKRIPLHLILALDCSGSMDGNKLTSVKTTTCKLIDHLTENDSLGILGFSHNVWDVFKVLPMTKENKETAKANVKALHTIGSTNLSEAMAMAMERAVISDDSKVCRIVLLTDGLPTCGEQSKDKLIEMACKINPTISLSTFGYGRDFDAELMMSISNSGRGSSFYIEKDEDCDKAFALELGGLLSLYAQNLKISVTPSGNMEFKELLSEYKCEQKQGYRLITKGKIEIQIDDIFAGEKKHIVLKLAIPKATEAVCARETRVCDLEVSWMDMESKSPETLQETAKIQYVKPGKESKTANDEVKNQLMLIEAARIQKEAKDKAAQGDYVGARSILSTGIQGIAGNFGPVGQTMKDMFANLEEGYADANAYHTKGAQVGAAYFSSMTRGRGTSAYAAPGVYCSSLQEATLQSFSAGADPNAVVNGSGVNLNVAGDLNVAAKPVIAPKGLKDLWSTEEKKA